MRRRRALRGRVPAAYELESQKDCAMSVVALLAPETAGTPRFAPRFCACFWWPGATNDANRPSVPLNQHFTLAPGESATIAGASARVELVRVAGDSRCPGDALCIQGGDALVHIVVHGEQVSDVRAAYRRCGRASIQHGALRITLIDLQPYPFSSRTIRPDEYRATFTRHDRRPRRGPAGCARHSGGSRC